MRRRPRKHAVFSGAFILALSATFAIGLSSSSASPPHTPSGVELSFFDSSWYDSQHGWKAGLGTVLSTEDGGRRWHRIGRFDVMGLARTSRVAGVVTETCHGTGPCPSFWTRDNGRHWYLASSRLVRGGYRGSAKFLFWPGETALFQVRPWPPRRKPPLRCRRIRECGPPAFDGGARAVRVASVSDGRIAELANIPGGAMAVIMPFDPATPVRVIFHRGGANSVTTLPVIPGVGLCEGFASDPAVEWPKISIFGCVGPNRAGVWISENGGATWQTYRR